MPDSRPDGNVRSVQLGIFAEDMKHSEYGIKVKTAYIGGGSVNRAPAANTSFCEGKTATARAGQRPLAGREPEAA